MRLLGPPRSEAPVPTEAKPVQEPAKQLTMPVPGGPPRSWKEKALLAMRAVADMSPEYRGSYRAQVDRLDGKRREAKQAQMLDRAMQLYTPQQQAMLRNLPPETTMNFLAERMFGQPEGPQYFKSNNDIISVQGGEANVIYDAPEAVDPAKLPLGMELDPETGRPRYMPEYVDGQKAIAEARGGNSENVQSVVTLDTGEIAIVRRDGSFEPTGRFARNPAQITDVGGVPTAVDRLTGETTALSTPEAVGRSESTIETVKANESDRRSAQQALPDLQRDAEYTINTIEKLLAHEGFDSRYGLTSAGGRIVPVPGGKGAGAQAIINQLGGQIFLQAYERLKGGGVITEIEGEKAEKALARALDQNTSPEEARAAFREFTEYVQKGLELKQKQASASYAPQEADAPVLVYNPAIGEFE